MLQGLTCKSLNVHLLNDNAWLKCDQHLVILLESIFNIMKLKRQIHHSFLPIKAAEPLVQGVSLLLH